MTQHSPAELLVQRLTRSLPREAAHEALDMMLRQLTTIERAGLEYNWRGFWARPKQLLPTAPVVRSVGLLAGRGFGKTRAVSEYVQREAASGRAMRIGLCAQNEDKTLEVMVFGKSGLIVTSPPWFKAVFENKRVLWPNGAQAFVYTPETPGALRGPEHHLFWATEIVAWPASTRDEAWSNIRRGTRLGYARTLWDTTPKRRHPLIRQLLTRASRKPDRHIVINGTTIENVSNLNPDEVAEWYEEIGGTQRGREELEGEFLDDQDGSLFKQAWIDRARRPRPESFRRRVVAIDPAISTRKGTDKSGIIELGLGWDDQIYVLANHSGKHAPEQWTSLVLDVHRDGHCDCIVIERNRGGDLIVSMLRAAALGRGVAVVVVDSKAHTAWSEKTIYVKEVYSRESKQTRADPVAMRYEKGLVSHVIGADLGELEDVMTTWEPSPSAQSPDELDALVHGVWEIARIEDGPMVSAVGIAERTREVKGMVTSPTLDIGDPRARAASARLPSMRQRGVL